MPFTYQLYKICKMVCHYLPGDMEGGGMMEKMTNGDIGERGI